MENKETRYWYLHLPFVINHNLQLETLAPRLKKNEVHLEQLLRIKADRSTDDLFNED